MVTEERARSTRWRRHGDQLLRILAAMPLGYAVASLWAMAIARLVPLPPLAATLTATMASFALLAAAAMWAYAARSGWRAIWTLALLGTVAAAIAWGSIQAGGRA